MNSGKYKRLLLVIITFLIMVFLVLKIDLRMMDLNGINLNRNDQVSLYDVFSEIVIVPLETKEESLITTISEIQYYNNCYYILDRRLQEVLCFDEEGNYLFKISKQGKGPGEYVHITHFSVDPYNSQLLLLDPSAGKIHCFDINGGYIRSISLGEVLGYNKVFSLNHDLILLWSVTDYELLYYSLNDEKFIQKEFEIPGNTVIARFNSLNPVYQFGHHTFFLPAFKRDIYNISNLPMEKHFTWCFGEMNNTSRQINRVLNMLQRGDNIYPGDVVEKKMLNYHILNAYENARFMISILEFDDDFKHIFIDKEKNKSYVFTNFMEKVALFRPAFSGNNLIMYSRNYDYSRVERNLANFNKEFLSGKNQKIIASHDPERDNPFLILYKLKN